MASDLSTYSLLALAAVLMWLGLLLLPWRPWSTRERIVADSASDHSRLTDVSVLIPARNEATCIAQTLSGLQRQGPFAKVVLVDDQSDDGTKAVAQQFDERIAAMPEEHRPYALGIYANPVVNQLAIKKSV